MIRIGNSRLAQRTARVTTGIRRNEEIFLINLEAIVHNTSSKDCGHTVTSSTQHDQTF